MGLRDLSARIISEWCMTFSKSSSLPPLRISLSFFQKKKYHKFSKYSIPSKKLQIQTDGERSRGRGKDCLLLTELTEKSLLMVVYIVTSSKTLIELSLLLMTLLPSISCSICYALLFLGRRFPWLTG